MRKVGKKLEEYVFGEVGVHNLLFGVSWIVAALVIIIFQYAYLIGFEAGGPGLIVVERISSLAVWNLATLIFGILGGYEIGRYVQTELAKRRKQLLRSTRRSR